MCREQKKEVKSASSCLGLGPRPGLRWHPPEAAGFRGLDVCRAGTAPWPSAHSAAGGWDRSGSPGRAAG